MDLKDVSIIEILPPNLAKDKNVRMMCEALDEELRRVIANIPGIAIIPNLVLKKITDELLLDLLAWQFHVDFYSTDFSVEKKQEVILKALDWHTRKGTPSVVEELVSAALAKAEVEEWFEYGGLPYRFRIYTEEQLPDMAALENLIRAIKSVKNTRSWFDMITSIAAAAADGCIGILPGIGGITHVLAEEYEPHAYCRALSRAYNRADILAREYEPHVYHGAVPEIYMRTNILSLEV